MICIQKGNKSQHTYSKDKNAQLRNVYHVSGFNQTFTEREFKKLFTV